MTTVNNNEQNKFWMRLPRNGKETVLFILIVSIVSVLLIAPLITMTHTSFNFENWVNGLKITPFLWPIIVAFVLLTQKPAEKLKDKIVAGSDSFRSQIAVQLFCNVFLMSLLLTVVGTWVGTGLVSLAPIIGFWYIWPTNFVIALFVELFIAHPFAHFIMNKIHERKDLKH